MRIYTCNNYYENFKSINNIIINRKFIWNTKVLVPLGKEKKLLISVLIGSIINFTLNLILIPIYKENGAAFATVVAEFIIMVVQVYFSKKQIRVYLSF
ncbi:hypothetical protein FZ989_00560 [Clostridium perfringens]|nr:hypothetical protein [Clostridium perfringens]